MRKQATSLSEESDVDIDNNSTTDSVADRKDFPLIEQVIDVFKEEVIEQDPLEIELPVKTELPIKTELPEIIELPVNTEPDVKEEIVFADDLIKTEVYATNHENYADPFLVESRLEDGSEFILDVIESEVSVFTEPCVVEEEVGAIESVEKETVYKADLITPSGKVMRVIVDDMPVGQPSKTVGEFLLILVVIYSLILQ